MTTNSTEKDSRDEARDRELAVLALADAICTAAGARDPDGHVLIDALVLVAIRRYGAFDGLNNLRRVLNP